jgi:Uma2 family endonuclease
MPLTVKDLEKLQELSPDYRMELVDGEVIVMSPSGYESEEITTRISSKLFEHVDKNRLGRVTGSNAGFILPNSDVRAPDVSFVLAQRLRKSPRGFAELAPDLIFEVKSPTDSLKKLREKIDSFLSQGTIVGILIHPEQRWIEIRRMGQEPVTLRDGEMLSVPDLLPGWEVRVDDLWSSEFN